MTLAGRDVREPLADFAFFAHDPADLQRPSVRFELTSEEIQLLNPNTGTCPIFRSRRDAEITLGIYRRVPVFINENDPVNGNAWAIRLKQAAFNMTSDSHHFIEAQELSAIDSSGLFGWHGGDRVIPLWESKMFHQFNVGWKVSEVDGGAAARYWVPGDVARDGLGGWTEDWLLGFRKVCRATDERTMIAAILPGIALGNSANFVDGLDLESALLLTAVFNSFATDFVLRQKMGGINLNLFYVEQLPIPSPAQLQAQRDRLINLSRRLAAQSGDSAAVRASIRAEVDAAMFHVYGVERDDVDYIMETFPIFIRKDVAAHGEYRTKRLILELFDQMAEAQRTGTPYRSPIDDLEVAL